ncbi:MAG: protein kinase [Myxococcales bacterium]|nr:protein kinase [Myxococcales bacterium]
MPGGELARIGRYRVLDEIASGGMATVHLGYAEDAPPGKFVAIKKMHAHYARDPDFASMFLDEAMVCKYIRHENVVVTLDVVKEGDELLLVLELVDGESLSKVIKPLHARKGRVPRAIVSAIVVDMLRGLHAAHEAKNEAGEPLLIVHRDVSPHNVVVSTEGRARVLDFGVAKARGRVQQTQKGQLKGKLAYMSPEQARGKAVDRRSDVFAAGIVLWELLVGQRLYDHDNEAALLVALISENPVAPSTKDASLADLDALVLKALAIQPDDRYATALDMADAVAATIPPASRTEVATWIKNEARSSLARRQALMTRAQARIARAAARGGLSSAPPPPRSGADAEELPWDIPTTTTDDIKSPKPSVSTPLPRPAAPAARPLHLAAPIPKVEAPVVSRDSDADEPEATLPLYTPPAEYLEKWKREAESKAAPPATTPPPAPAPAVALPFGPQLPPASTAAPTSSSPHVVPAAFAAQAPSVITPRGVPGSMLETMRISEPPEARAEAVPSQVTSVTLTTTDMPPPLPPEQVRRLTLIGSITAAVAAMVAIAVLVIATKKPWSPKPAETAGRGLGLVQLQAARAGTAAEQAARAAVEPPPAEAVPASAASSAAPAASSAAPAASSAAPPPPRPPQQKAAPSQTSWPPKSTGAAPGKAASTSTSKPRR